MPYLILAVLALGHFLIDLGSGLVLYSYGYLFLINQDLAVSHALIYNFFAFGSQAFWALAIDRFRLMKLAALSGTILIIISLNILNNPMLANILASTGNALFHLGAGALVISLFPGKAYPLGIFVGPGAIGIGLSLPLAAKLEPAQIYVTTLLIFLALAIGLLPQKTFASPPRLLPRFKPRGWLIVLLLVISTIIRSYGGLSLAFGWKTEVYLALLLLFALAGGKILGGFVTDYLGRIPTALALIPAAGLLAYFAHNPITGLIGILLFQSTMALTLLALCEQFPDHPAFAFGLLCFALWLGVIVHYYLPHPFGSSSVPIFSLTLLSCLALCLALVQRKKQLDESE